MFDNFFLLRPHEKASSWMCVKKTEQKSEKAREKKETLRKLSFTRYFSLEVVKVDELRSLFSLARSFPGLLTFVLDVRKNERK